MHLLCVNLIHQDPSQFHHTLLSQAESEAAAKAACSSKRACATSYPTRAAYGLLWVWPDEAPTAEADAAAVHPVADAPQQEFDRRGQRVKRGVERGRRGGRAGLAWGVGPVRVDVGVRCAMNLHRHRCDLP